jgi:hypothetical protein
MTVDELFWGKSGTLTALLSDAFTFADAGTAKLQGLTGPTGAAFVRVSLDPARHAGLLTAPPVMALLATRTDSSPIARGKFVRERILCQTLPAPPPNVPPAPKANPMATTRERFAQHTASPECAGCHRLIDPVGFGFEGFDGGGRSRDTENGRPVDASGNLEGTDVDGPFAGAPALGRRLLASDGVRACLATTWFRYAFGRDEAPGDACAIDRLRAHLGGAGNRLDGLLSLLLDAEAFPLRADAPLPGGQP